MSNEFDIERMCRLNGQQPTPRERWTAFYRLYRISRRHGVYQDMAAVDCFRVLFRDWSWLRLCEAAESSPSRVHAPAFLRRRLLEHDRRRRLHGDHPEWAERDKLVGRKVREEGIEATLDQVTEAGRRQGGA